MSENGYLKKFVENSIQRQLKIGSMGPDIRKEDSDSSVTARIPYIDGLSQQIRRVACAAGIRCSFTSSTTLEELHNCKDRLDKSHITPAVYYITCATCESMLEKL